MNTITTTSGHIINLDLMAMVTADGRYPDQPVENSTLTIHFSATVSTPKNSRSMRLSLRRDEAVSFLTALKTHGVEVEATLKALDEKVIAKHRDVKAQES